MSSLAPRVWLSTFSIPIVQTNSTSHSESHFLLLRVVTGASSGFGRCMAEFALKNGDNVVATLRNPADLDGLKSHHPDTQLLVLTLDVTKPQEIIDAFAKTREVFGRLDVVFNSAGYGLLSEVEGTPDDVARVLFETNFWGAANVSREAVKFFREVNPSGTGGRLLTVSSFVGLQPLTCCGYYSASKHGKPPFLVVFSSGVILKPFVQRSRV